MSTELSNITTEKQQIQKSFNRLISNMNLMQGTKKLFTPEQLALNALEYFEYCQNNPIKSNQLITGGNKGGEVIQVDKPRMFTIEGLCLSMGVNTKYLYDLIDQVKDKTDIDSIRYSHTFNLIRETVRTQRFEYSAVREFDGAFIAKLEGLTDKVEHSGEVKNTVTSITFTPRTIEDADFSEVQDALDQE